MLCRVNVMMLLFSLVWECILKLWKMKQFICVAVVPAYRDPSLFSVTKDGIPFHTSFGSQSREREQDEREAVEDSDASLCLLPCKLTVTLSWLKLLSCTQHNMLTNNSLGVVIFIFWIPRKDKLLSVLREYCSALSMTLFSVSHVLRLFNAFPHKNFSLITCLFTQRIHLSLAAAFLLQS